MVREFDSNDSQLRHLWLRFALFTCAGATFGAICWNCLVILIYKLQVSPANIPIFVMLINAFRTGAFAAGISLFQWLCLRRATTLLDLWLWLTMLGLALALGLEPDIRFQIECMIAEGGMYEVVNAMHGFVTETISEALAGVIFGSIVSIMQWLALRRIVSRALYWIFLGTAIVLVGWMARYVLSLVVPSFAGYSLPCRYMLDTLVYTVPMWFAVGVIQGVVLRWLLRRPSAAAREQARPPASAMGEFGLSKPLWFGSIYVLTFLNVLNGFAAMPISRAHSRLASGEINALLLTTLYVLSTTLTVCTALIWSVLWYKAWASIQDGHARTTAGKAIGFLLIPIFNFYWLFQAFWGFARDYNSFIKRNRLQARELSEGLFLVQSILILSFALLTILGRIIQLTSFSYDPFRLFFYLSLAPTCTSVIVCYELCDAINWLRQSQLQIARQSKYDSY